MNLVDTHCHLHREEFDPDRNEVVARAKEAGVTALIDPATDLASNRIVVELASQFPEVYVGIGLHPHDAAQLDAKVLEELASLATDEKVVAIGEIGLDYYRNLSPQDVQQKVLREFLRLAHELGKPVILHCRSAEARGEASSSRSRDADSDDGAYRDLFTALRECLKPPIRGVLHCFGGSSEVAKEALDLGLYLSFAGNLTFSKAQGLRAIAATVPFDRVLLETDAPFLAPQSFRGKRNEPAYLSELVNLWSQIRDLTAEDVARTTTTNVYHLFGIGDKPPSVIAYPIRRSLYLNITNACTDRCVFCSLSLEDFWKGKGPSPFVKGHNLRIERDPTAEEVLHCAGDPSRFEEVVYCGYGEPIIRLDLLVKVARELKHKGTQRIRLNTNGHGNLIHRRSIAPELKGLIDEVSVSLNTPTAQQYLEICRPVFGFATYEGIKAFIRECRDIGIKVTATAVAMPGIDLEACRRVAEEELKVAYRIRTYNDVG